MYTATTPQRLMLFCLLAICALVGASCAYGPKTEKKSKLNYLSGEHYEGTGPKVADVPVVKDMPEVRDTPVVETIPLFYKRKVVPTVIKGTVVVDEFRPLKYKNLLLLQGDTVILKTTTDHVGAFKFSGSLPNGQYLIKVEDERYNGEQPITVDKYEIESVLVKAAESAPE